MNKLQEQKQEQFELHAKASATFSISRTERQTHPPMQRIFQ
jgi:hypothetical protein